MSDARGASGNLPHFSISVHCRILLLFIIGLPLDRPWECRLSLQQSPVVSRSPVKRLQTNHLGSTLGRAHPSQVLCQSFRAAGSISAVTGSQGSGGGGT